MDLSFRRSSSSTRSSFFVAALWIRLSHMTQTVASFQTPVFAIARLSWSELKFHNHSTECNLSILKNELSRSFYILSSEGSKIHSNFFTLSLLETDKIHKGTPGKCPPGLEFLLPTSSLFVVKNIELVEILLGFETENSYAICNDRQEALFWAQESSHVCGRLCIPLIRPLHVIILDLTDRKELLILKRPLRCLFCCIPKFSQVMEVYTPTGLFLGKVRKNFKICIPELVVSDGNGEIVFFIRGSCCKCCQVTFQVLSRNRDVIIGKITKQWSGLVREAFTDADYFTISYPSDLDVKMKAVLIGAMFLIDIIYFEDSNCW